MRSTRQTTKKWTKGLGVGLDWLRGRLWIWPLVAGVVVLVTGLFFEGSLRSSARELRQVYLQTLLDTESKSLLHWMSGQEANLRLLAADPEFRGAVQSLMVRPDLGRLKPLELARLEEAKALNGAFASFDLYLGYEDFLVLDAGFRVVASSVEEKLGLVITPGEWGVGEDIAGVGARVTMPRVSRALVPDSEGVVRAGMPVMYVVAPVKSRQGEVVALLACRLDPAREFSEVLELSRFGDTGEAYALNRDGYMISRSRFEGECKALGLIPDLPQSTSILSLKLLDPGMDLRLGGKRPSRGGLSLTRLAEAATRRAMAGGDGELEEASDGGVDVEGYRNYRGAEVVGAWRWLDAYGLAVAVEVEQAELKEPYAVLRRATWAAYGVLVLGAVGLGVLSRWAAGLQLRLARESRRLGQYDLGEEIGRGSNGRVFKAVHKYLRRPVAVKLLDDGKEDRESIARFEREVQATSRLTHPNTVVVYDYGRTEEGLFYYAMEYLEGLSLDRLVERFGPLSEGRVIWILRQACMALAEAHERGLVHRDIKPANLFLTRRGGMADVVKVLDFGLVKGVGPHSGVTQTVSESLVGTPQFLSPEGILKPDEVDARSDLYSLGAVGFFLLTGTPVFTAEDLGELLAGHGSMTPDSPSQRRGSAVDAGLEAVMLQCLEKNPGLRPVSARELEKLLSGCASAGGWSQEEGDRWWREHGLAES
jgi:hypothetical protein